MKIGEGTNHAATGVGVKKVEIRRKPFSYEKEGDRTNE